MSKILLFRSIKWQKCKLKDINDPKLHHKNERNRYKPTVSTDNFHQFHYDIYNLVKVMATNVGSIINPNKIANTFKLEMKSTIQPSTISKYIEHFEDSFLLNFTCKYDLIGRKFIGTSYKYYFEDIELLYAASAFVGKDQVLHFMENIIILKTKPQDLI